MTTRIKYICDACGSNELVFDTTSSWNADTQSFELEGEYDHNPCCNSEDCQGDETSYHTVDADTGNQVENWRGVWIDRAEYLERLSEQNRANEAERHERKALALAHQNAEILGLAYA